MLQPRNLSTAVPLVLLPLGDSITDGWYSSDDNGYRLDLRNLLNATGIPVDFIGSKTGGSNNTDNQFEAFAGKTINEIHQHLRDDNILAQQPNVVLLHAGTNDMNLDPPHEPYDTAPVRLGALVDEVLCRCPSTVLMVAEIIEDNNAQDRVNKFNAQIPQLVDARKAEGYKVALVNLSSLGGSNLYDAVHPNDRGYLTMADVWFRALQALPSDWITVPGTSANTSASQDVTCSNAATNGTATLTLLPATSTAPLVQSASVAASTSSTSSTAGSASTPSPTRSSAARARSPSVRSLLCITALLLGLVLS